MPQSVDVELNLDYIFKELNKALETKLILLKLQSKNPTTEERNAVLKSILTDKLESKFNKLIVTDRERLITMSAKKYVLNSTDDFDGNVEVTDENIESMIQMVLNNNNNNDNNNENDNQDIWDQVNSAKAQFENKKSSELLQNQNGIEFQAKTVDYKIRSIRSKLFVKVHPTFQLPSEIDPDNENSDQDDLEVGGGIISLNCPISQTMMSTPVRNGRCIHVYDQENIQAYKRNGNSICPECSAPLENFKPDHIMTQRILSKKLQDSWGWKEEIPNEDQQVVDKL